MAKFRQLALSMFTLILLPISTSSTAQDELLGSFGKVFGQLFDPIHAMGSTQDDYGNTLYQFAPKSPYYLFTHYYVTLTPSSKKVASIIATGPINDRKDCKQKRSQLSTILNSKYFSHSRKRNIIDQGNRSAVIECARLKDKKNAIMVTYKDSILIDRAEKEFAKIRDTSGL